MKKIDILKEDFLQILNFINIKQCDNMQYEKMY